ncbi:MAG: hypothetical protein GTN80_07655 [Nitrososphaeria archaeon]|nr:hypothetical protein [Nitrososphaeria archaeon]NIN52940.1 hypothetical protein [Nitrososphaeria archaeon]NIQ33499.1 hypothetical protein [Nitrososphaeria archaeon]
MSSRKITLIAAIVIVIVACVVAGYMYLQLSYAETKLTFLNMNLSSTTEELKAAEEKLIDLNTKLLDTTEKLSATEKKLASLNTSLSVTTEKLTVTEERNTQLQSSLRDEQIEKSRLETLLLDTNTSLSKVSQELVVKQAELAKSLDELQTAREQIEAMDKNMALMEKNITTLEKEVALKDEKVSSLSKVLTRLDNDRKLLIQLRMKVPETRNETHDYWSDVRNLSVQSDPSLGFSVDAIIANIDGYYDWLETMPGADSTITEYCMWLFTYPPEAYEYDQAVSDFRGEVYLTVINHIRTAVDLIS